MVLDGRSIVEKRFLSFPDDLYDNEVVVQPNGVDLRVNKVFHITGRAELPVDTKMLSRDVQIHEIPLKNGQFELAETVGNYLVDFRESISVKDGWCAILKTRSSLARVGTIIDSGLWDTGFEGRLGCEMQIANPLMVHYGARICQVLFLEAAFNGHRYSGSYQNLASGPNALR